MAQNVVAVHYEKDFDMIFHFNVAKNFVAEYDERDFDMIFHLKLETAENFVGLQHERDLGFSHDFPL